MSGDEGKLNSVLLTDCGSTTTKAILLQDSGHGLRLRVKGQAPTTVEAPVEDVTVGVVNAVKEVEELASRSLLSGDGIKRPEQDGKGVDAYLSTSSAGGGLQMIVVGVVGTMTGESAMRAALGAGAIVTLKLSYDDGMSPHERIEAIRNLKPDMVLLAGGTDGGTRSHVLEMAELLAEAGPRPRLGEHFRLPLVFAGNREVAKSVAGVLGRSFDVKVVENLRPVLEEENLEPARQEIHRLFLDHVMAHAPGYPKLMQWVDGPIMPTPGAVGDMVRSYSMERGLNVLAVDIGGATTDVFSSFCSASGEEPVFNRTVSANLGMSYSIGNVLKETGVENILRWIPDGLKPPDVLDRLGNKLVRPTTIPETIQDLVLEHAVAREALRLSLEQHARFARGLSGLKRTRTLADTFRQKGRDETILDMERIDLIIGSGGVLSNAPARLQAAAILVDAFQPKGVTRLAVDSIFMLPHLGVLASRDPASAASVLEKDCLVELGTCVGVLGRVRDGRPCLRIEIVREGQAVPQELIVDSGALKRVAIGPGTRARIGIRTNKGFHLGNGLEQVSFEMVGGEMGLLLDCRGRPLQHGYDSCKGRCLARGWFGAGGLYSAWQG